MKCYMDDCNNEADRQLPLVNGTVEICRGCKLQYMIIHGYIPNRSEYDVIIKEYQERSEHEGTKDNGE